MGSVELTDQIGGVKFLRTLPYVDETRIGVYGHSYGGYMTLMAMFKPVIIFKRAWQVHLSQIGGCMRHTILNVLWGTLKQMRMLT